MENYTTVTKHDEDYQIATITLGSFFIALVCFMTGVFASKKGFGFRDRSTKEEKCKTIDVDIKEKCEPAEVDFEL